MSGYDTGEQVRWLRLLGVLLAGLAVVWLAVAYLAFSTEGSDENGPLPREEYAWAFDLEAYLGAADRVASEGSPYAEAVTAGAFESGPGGLYYYSPVLAVTLLPIEDVPLTDISTWWFIVHVLALIAACVLMPVGALVRLFAFAVAAFSLAVVRDMALGNISTLLLLPMVMAWRWMDRPLGSAALAIAMSLRPSLGLLLVWQGLRRRWHALAWTIASAIVLVVLTLPFVGIDGYLDYLDALRNLNTPSNAAAPPNGWQNHDLGEVAQSLGASADAMGLVRLGSIALGVGAMLLSLRRDREISYMVTLMASFIVVPILWDHYLVMLVIPAAFLAQRWRPIAILLPLLSWLPSLGFFAIVAAMLLPFLVRDAAPETPDASPEAVPGA